MKQGPSELKVLAAGFHSSITHSFIAVMRDADTYFELTKLDGNLPKLDQEFFKSNVLVAAFLGERNTGGYSVEMTREGSNIRIAEQKPGKGVMVPQMITSPFRVVALEGMPNAPVWLALDEAWQKSMPSYRITSGTFATSGDFAGTSEHFGLQGAVSVMRESKLATLQFRIVGSQPMKSRALNDYATGLTESDGRLAVNKLSPGSLINEPNSGLKAAGTFSRLDHKLSLTFVPLPLMIADGYTGQGGFEAEIENPLVKPKPNYE